MKYGYDKKLLKSLGVGPFLGQVKLREKMIAEASDELPTSIYNANILAKKLHPNDIRRVIRALEIYETSGKAKSARSDEQQKEGPYHVLVYGLSMPREMMYKRINARVDQMIQDGLIDEVKSLLARGIKPREEGGAMQAIGYKEIVSALHDEMSMEQAIALIKQSSRRYAKRQWTWFRRDQRTKWFDWTEFKGEEALYHALLAQIHADLSEYHHN